MRSGSERLGWCAGMLATLLVGCTEVGGDMVSMDVAPAGETVVTPPEPVAAPSEPAAQLADYVPGPMAMRRLTRAQYVTSVKAIFGDDVDVLVPTEVDLPVEGLYSVGGSATSVTPAGIERYELAARLIAAYALSEERREEWLSCAPESDMAADDSCAEVFVEALAPRVLRRALRDGETAAYVSLAGAATEAMESFYGGLEAVLSAWLLTPDFLFIQERAAPEEATWGRLLTGEALASRLSYFLWNQGPDDELMSAAMAGELETEQGYLTQLDRLLADGVRLEVGVRALFTDLYHLDDLAGVTKDASAFPQFTNKVLVDAKEQTLRTIVDHLLVQRRDYRGLFTTRKTFMTRNLGPIYQVPVADDWEAYEFPEGGARAGILSHVSFLALHARTSRSSPVLRGEFVLDKILCNTIPPPPPDVNFDTLTPGDPAAPTARERLAAHRIEPSCAGCHDLIDPIGLALENFDAIGQFRTHEAGAEIATYGQLEGISYDNVQGFYTALHDAPRVTKCMVKKLYMHAVGRKAVSDESEVLTALAGEFAMADYDFVALMKNIALTHGFRATSGAKEASE
ncbi:MAG: DUF1588 domain-containing protein [Myxococcota bacterium]